MSTPPNDDLYRIFEERLFSGEFDDQPVDHLLSDVVERYWDLLDATKKVPTQMQAHVRNDLMDEVRDMLRRKIYGHLDVGEYNRTRARKG